MGLLSSIGQKFGLARNYILPNYFDIGWKMRTYTSEDSLLVSSKGVPTLLLFSNPFGVSLGVSLWALFARFIAKKCGKSQKNAVK